MVWIEILSGVVTTSFLRSFPTSMGLLSTSILFLGFMLKVDFYGGAMKYCCGLLIELADMGFSSSRSCGCGTPTTLRTSERACVP